MAVTTNLTNKPILPRGNDQSPKGYNRAALYSGKALDFDGVNDKITTSLALTNDEVSVSFYLNWDDVGTQTIGFICEGSANDKMMIHTGASGAGVNGLQIAINITNYSVPQIISEGWNHYLITSDRTNLNIYKNGVLFDSRTTDAGAIDITALTLGVRPIGSAYALDGQLSNFKVYSTALTAAQVADLYNNPEKIVPTGVEDTALKLWLPMMEGAGTTAYDGSGNGNHGTISGATYVNGVGAPVAQSAVIDWNKGTNLVVYSEQLDDSAWNKNNLSISANDTTAPDGQNTADKITVTGAGVSIVYDSIPFDTENYMVSVYVKPGTSRYVYLRDQTDGVVKGTQWYDLQTASVGGSSGIIVDANIESANNGFYRISLECDSSASGTENLIVLGLTSSPTNAGGSIVGEYVHAWGFQAERKTTLGPYIPTLSTAQTSPVLLPQGLTTGRDITGVNLFENVRKQGALNLDGNSWAEVHDNASLDITPNITLEAWIKCGDELNAVYDHIFVKPTSTTWTSPYGTYVLRLRENDVQWWFESVTNAKSYSVSLSGWNHLAVTKEGASEILYINGAQVDTKTGSATMSATIYDLLIGTRTQYATNEMIANQLAQPRIYNRALTAEEVQRNYDAGKNIYS